MLQLVEHLPHVFAHGGAAARWALPGNAKKRHRLPVAWGNSPRVGPFGCGLFFDFWRLVPAAAARIAAAARVGTTSGPLATPSALSWEQRDPLQGRSRFVAPFR